MALNLMFFSFLYRKSDDVGPRQKASHLMDLLDISLDAANISSPPGPSDPWGGVASPPPPPRPQVHNRPDHSTFHLMK